MTSARAHARVMIPLRDIGAAKLRSSEQVLTRLAADSLLVCEDIGDDRSARAVYADDVWACGPAFDLALRAA